MRFDPTFPRRHVLVVGWGNPLRRDDGAGLRVVERLRSRWPHRVRTVSGAQPLPEWVYSLATVDVVYFVDASTDPRVTDARVTALDTADEQPVLGPHLLGPTELVALCRALYGRAPRAYLVEIATSDLRIGRGLSPRTTAAVARATRWLSARLTRSKSSRPGVLPLGFGARDAESTSEDLDARSRSHARLS